MSNSKIDLLRKSSSEDIPNKLKRLAQVIEEKGRGGVVLAFSGGVDSSTLAALCYDLLGERVVAATAKSPTYPDDELEDARKMAREIGIKHYVVETDELSNDDFAKNPENRCYYCKKELLDRLQGLAQMLGFEAVFEGTNFSDLGGHRPGFNAVREHNNVFSPWVESGFTKEEIRVVAQKLGLSIHDKPSLACLASRIPFDERITKERLERVDRAEQYVKKISGVRQVRVRDHDGLARIEVGRDERKLVLDVEIMDQIAHKLRELGFSFITLDMEGYRTGSMTAAMEGSEKK
ncbi:MAG: ATP-dependent sacrificial sulfur transferase LarE [Nitrososphaeria archaeon]